MWTPGAIETCGGYWDGQYYGIPFELSDYVALDQHRVHEGRPGSTRRPICPRHGTDFVAVAKKLVKVENGVTVRNGFMCNSKEGIFNFLVILAR